MNELRHDELDLTAGRIIRHRTKTKRHPNPPIVNYKLWKTTVDLLKRIQSDDPEFVLLTERGRRLTPKMAEQLADGRTKVKTWDNVSNYWKRLRKENSEIGDKVLKYLRKTGSTTLKGDVRYGWLDQLYLGQSTTIADKHYNAHDGRIYAPLDQAIAYLGKRFGIR